MNRPLKQKQTIATKATHVLCLGNSITFHPYRPEIGWLSEHGMAASRPERDYCHLLEQWLKEHDAESTVTGINIADYEVNFRRSFRRIIGKHIDGKDTIIVRIGENVRNTKCFAWALRRLVRWCMRKANRVIICGCVWKDESKEHALKATAEQYGLPFVELDWIMSEHPETYPKVGDELIDRDRNPYRIEKDFIITHPNDIGMRMIAEAIYKKIKP